jgi:hypothetical protein
MTSDNTTKHHYRSVKVRMTPEQVANYVPYHRGLDLNFYAPEFEDTRMRDLNKARKMITSYDLTITTCSINPNILHARDMRDIDEELALIDSKYGIIKDHLTHTDNKKLIHSHQASDNLTKHATIMSHPYLEGENDHLRSKATDVHKVQVKMEDVKDFEKHIEKRRAFFRKVKLDYIEKMDPQTGEKMAEFDFGYIT